jgi:chromosome segregation ATPase
MNTDNEARGLDITEQPTGEFPTITQHDLTIPNNVVELNGASRASSTESDESAKAAFWLSRLESEVARLHAKWETIDGELKVRDARIADLHGQIAARETTIAKLKAEVESEVAAVKAAEERLTSKDGEIAALTDDRRSRDARIAALSGELADAEGARKAAREEAERARAEIARLNEIARQEQAAAAASVQRHEEMVAEQQRLQTKLQDLDVYISGRHDSWVDQETKLAEYKDALSGMEKTLKARDAVIARHDEEKQRLAASIQDLERQCAELAGRRKEREEAYAALQKQLTVHVEQAEQLKADHASRTKEMEHAAKQVVDHQHHIESLERSIQRRDENIAALSSELEQSKSAVAELTSSRSTLATRVDELERGVAERSQQVQALRGDLRISHDQLKISQQQLSDRSAQLATTQEAADHKTRHSDHLTKELEAVRKEAAQARAELEKIEAHAAELGRLRGAAVAESESLKAELAIQYALVKSLGAELKSKQATADLLERSVGRITNLGASLAALDKHMATSAEEKHKREEPASDESVRLPVLPPVDASMPLSAADKSSINLADFGATIAADDRAEAAVDAAANGRSDELLPIDELLDQARNLSVVDVGEVTAIHKPSARKLVVMIAGEAHDYPLVKSLMTIGRADDADIRIPSHFVSRLHARISTKGIATIIEDAGSKNGILVNSERVNRRVLRHGDVVSLGGELNLRFVDSSH